MNNTVNIWMGSEDFVQSLLVCHIDLVEYWSLTAKKLNAVKGNFRGIVERIDDYDLVAMLEERERGERSNVSGSTRFVALALIV